MKSFLVIFVSILFLNEFNFRDEFKQEIAKADNYYEMIKPELKQSSQKYETDHLLMSAIIYPELLRYSLFEDFFITKALESLYIRGGSELANYSIGRFQMKPAFVEKMELLVLRHPEIFVKFAEIARYETSDIFVIREERIERLKSLEWQIIYLNCFYKIVEKRFSDLNFENKNAKLRFYATAYNHGFDCPKEEIIEYSHKKCFPDACDCESRIQFNFSDISVYFYDRIRKR